MSVTVNVEPRPVPESWDRSGLPAWSYHSRALLALEKRDLFATHWQIAGHVCDVPNPGDYLSFDIGDERVLIIRGQDGVVRAVHNLCRHRGARVVGNEAGHCRNALVCPFHGWVYNLDGSLRGPARPKSFGPIDRAKLGLKPMEMDIWHGFIFVRCRPGPQPAVAELLAPFETDFAAYRLGEIVPTRGFTQTEIPVNWKSVRDVDNEGYHVAMAHPALQDLYGAGYLDRTFYAGLSKSYGPYSPHAGRRWSVRNYLRIAPEQAWLPEDKRRAWMYYGIFPNGVFAMTPESVQFYQEFPLSIDRTLIRGAIYRRPEEGRVQRTARYLAHRIDRETYDEDIQLSIWSNESMKSSAFDGFHLSDLEFGVRNHHDQLRRILPILTVEKSPGEDHVEPINAALRAAGAAAPGDPMSTGSGDAALPGETDR
jgi:phenylpropionate dioxygenase-like ring-hydroxylating dioxygenase large terminal subunit